MRLKPPDSSEQDYLDRRREFMRRLVADTRHDMFTRLNVMQEWIAKNSPYTAAEQLENLKRALED